MSLSWKTRPERRMKKEWKMSSSTTAPEARSQGGSRAPLCRKARQLVALQSWCNEMAANPQLQGLWAESWETWLAGQRTGAHPPEARQEVRPGGCAA
jgi:hypothetical protein